MAANRSGLTASVVLIAAGVLFLANSPSSFAPVSQLHPIVTLSAGTVSLKGPRALAIDRDILYIADDESRIVRLDLRSGALDTLRLSRPLKSPNALAPDQRGGLLVVESGQLSRVGLDDGAVTIVAGTGDYGDSADEIPALKAKFNILVDVAVGRLGDVFVADSRVRRVDPLTGLISSVAGTPRRPGDDWVISGDGRHALAAGLGVLRSVAVDPLGNLYLAQSGEFADGHRIRRVDAATGTIETVAGPGTPIDAGPNVDERQWRIEYPRALRWDERGGLLFLADVNGHRILHLDPDSRVVRAIAGSPAGSEDDGVLASEALVNALDLAVDAEGNIFFADYSRNRVRRIDRATRRVSTVASGQPRETLTLHHPRIEYAAPAREACQNELTEPVLVIDVSDETGGELPGVSVYAIQASATVNATVGQTDEAGRVTLRLPRSGDYAVTLVLQGFRPEVRAVRLSSGCSGYLAVKLPLAILQ